MRVVHSGECERAFGSLLPQCTAGPLCRFKSCPSEPANSSCSIFIKPLSLKEPYPDHGKSHSSCSHSHALSILALIPLLPALLCLSHSLSSFLSPPTPPPFYLSCRSVPPPFTLSLSLSASHTYTQTHSFSLSHSYIHKHTRIHNTHAQAHTRPLNPSESSIPVQAGGKRCWRGFSAALSLRVLCYHLGKKRVSIVFSFLFLSFLEC